MKGVRKVFKGPWKAGRKSRIRKFKKKSHALQKNLIPRRFSEARWQYISGRISHGHFPAAALEYEREWDGKTTTTQKLHWKQRAAGVSGEDSWGVFVGGLWEGGGGPAASSKMWQESGCQENTSQWRDFLPSYILKHFVMQWQLDVKGTFLSCYRFMWVLQRWK